MTNKNVTKRALTTSALAILACIAMLIGTTFAWFTDTASTAVNRIVSGNLHVELAYKNADTTDFTTANATTKVFRDGALWEPGYTEYVVLKVSNAGSLALKYRLGVNIAAEVGSTNVLNDAFKLSDYIRFAVLDGDKSTLSRSDMIAAATDSKLIKEGFTSDETPLFPNGTEGKDTEKIVTLVVWMPTTVGNVANYKAGAAAPSIDLGINVLATQYTYENDSFNDRYDEDAAYPVRVDANVNDEGDTVLKDKETDHTIKLTAPAGSLSSESTDVRTLTLVKTETATPSSLSVTATQNSKSYEITLKDQNGKTVSANAGTLFEVEMQIGKNRTGVSVYHNGAAMQNDGATLTDVADHFVYDETTGYVTMKVDHFSPFTAVYDKENWENSAATAYASVDDTAKTLHIADAAQLALFSKDVSANKYLDYTVVLDSDIDLGGKLWTPIGVATSGNNLFHGTFDGNHHKISNMTISDKAHNYIGLFCRISADVKDLTLEKATITGQRSGVLAGACGDGTISNVTVTDAAIIGHQKCGGLIGFAAGHENFQMHHNKKLAVIGCTVKNVTINAEKMTNDDYGTSFGGLIGYVHRYYNLEVADNTVSGIAFGNLLGVGHDVNFFAEHEALYEQYFSHALVGAIISNVPAASAGDAAYESAVAVFNNNTVEQVSSIPTGSTTTQYFGFCYSAATTAANRVTKILIDGTAYNNYDNA